MSDVSGVEKRDHLEYCRYHYLDAEPGKYKGFILRTPNRYPHGDQYHPYNDGLGEAMELLVDLNSWWAVTTFQENYQLFKEHRADLITGLTVRLSVSGEHHHAIVGLKFPLPFYERVMLQACLGSDPKREMLHYVHSYKREKHPIILIWRNDGSNLADGWGLA